MITIFRRHQRILMLVIAVLTIIAFAFFYNPPQSGELGGNGVVRLYNKTLTQTDIEREIRNYQLSLQLGQYELLQALGGMSRNEQMGMQDYIFNRLVLKHEAEARNIHPTEEQINAYLMALPALQTNGQYDPNKYKAFIAERLGPKGFDVDQMRSVALDALRLKSVKGVISAPVTTSPLEVKQALRAFQKVDLQIVRFPLVEVESFQVSDEELKTFYNTNSARLVSPENRVVKYVEFALPADQASVTGKAKVEAVQKLLDAADSFVEKATASGASFDAAAQAAGLKVQETQEFDQAGMSQAERQIASALGAGSEGQWKGIAPAAFMLTEQDPVSNVVQVGDSVYVLKLEKVMPTRPLTVEEVRPIAEVQLRLASAQQQTQEKARAAWASLREAVAAGKPLADAATALGLKVNTVTGLEPMQAQNSEETPVAAVRLSMMMEPAQLSGYIPTPDGGFSVFVTARAPLAGTPEEQAKQQNEVRTEIASSAEEMYFITWLDAAREAAGIAAVNSR